MRRANNPVWKSRTLTFYSACPSGLLDFCEDLGNGNQTFPCKPEEDSGNRVSEAFLQGGRTAAQDIRGVKNSSTSAPHPVALNSGSHSALSVGLCLSLSLCILFCSAVTVTQPESVSPSSKQWDFRKCLCLDSLHWQQRGAGAGGGEQQEGHRLAGKSCPCQQAGAFRQEALWLVCRVHGRQNFQLSPGFCSLSQGCVG